MLDALWLELAVGPVQRQKQDKSNHGMLLPVGGLMFVHASWGRMKLAHPQICDYIVRDDEVFAVELLRSIDENQPS